MKRIRSSLVTLALLLVLPSAGAQTGGDFDLTWNTIDGGGSASTGDGLTLDGTVGQPDAGLLSGGDFTLEGGFWAAVAAPACLGDCNRDRVVAVDELVTIVNIALDDTLIARCARGDLDGNGQIAVGEVITVVKQALRGCS